MTWLSAGYSLVLLLSLGTSALGQVSAAGDTDSAGRILAKVVASVTDSRGARRPVSQLEIVIEADNGNRVSIRTDDAGVAAAWLVAGRYRFVTAEPVTWEGATHAWDIAIDVRPGMPPIPFTNANANTVIAGRNETRREPSPTPPSAVSRLRVFTDCRGAGCDLDYFRSEITFVDHVRDQADASLHILVTSQPTATGGAAYTVNFIGLREHIGVADTMTYTTPPSTTQGETRSGIMRLIKLGAVRFVARTPYGNRLTVIDDTPALATSSASIGPAEDRWNLWIFRLDTYATFSGEESQNFLSLRGSTSANRTSDAWKFRVGVTTRYNESRYTFADGSEIADYSHSFDAEHVLVKSLGQHWSIGEKASLTSSTFLNQDASVRFAPTVEFNLFPYAQSTRRQLTLQYSVGFDFLRYRDTTVFDKLSETRPHQALKVSLDFKQPWGSMRTALEGASYLDDLDKYRAVLFTAFDVRVFKGLSVNFYAGGSLLRDQLYLAKGTLSDEDILLRRRQLASDYSYYGGAGFSYTFGSIYNNVVNTRFDGPGGN